MPKFNFLNYFKLLNILGSDNSERIFKNGTTSPHREAITKNNYLKQLKIK
jgi:hypothetical protein